MAQAIREGPELINEQALAAVCFTPRQLQVLAGLVRGDLQVKIADCLGISESRGEGIVSDIKRKLNAPRCPAAVAKAVALGLVNPFDDE